MDECISSRISGKSEGAKCAIEGTVEVLWRGPHHGSECVSCSEKCSNSSAMQGMGDKSVWKDVMPHASSRQLSSLHSDTCKQWRTTLVREWDQVFIMQERTTYGILSLDIMAMLRSRA